jgi:hypothetical protein
MPRLDLRISRNPEGMEVIEEATVPLTELLARVECENLEILERIFRSDEQLDKSIRSLALARTQKTKWEGVVYDLELRPRLFAAASHRLELLSTKLLNSPNNSPVDGKVDKKEVKVIPIQFELSLKLPPG